MENSGWNRVALWSLSLEIQAGTVTVVGSKGSTKLRRWLHCCIRRSITNRSPPRPRWQATRQPPRVSQSVLRTLPREDLRKIGAIPRLHPCREVGQTAPSRIVTERQRPKASIAYSLLQQVLPYSLPNHCFVLIKTRARKLRFPSRTAESAEVCC